ncbi:hypothetical protein CDO52_12785 [Nocardiopsis gilva YIM 90087]|uniref:Uncharacterized protein n=2 Tax=Nocardiopsis gilva TaxID=280236 RepID=A0A223S605_9ACTN|nr:hypothetical protein [Nocardiopsis gilva]ASU83545.1 hypothetical protein CDO52_12785 [Nocardiopsis gilva YIM 90087]
MTAHPDDLHEDVLHPAGCLVAAVHHWDAAEVQHILTASGIPREGWPMCVALAAQVPAKATQTELLAWTDGGPEVITPGAAARHRAALDQATRRAA